MAAHTDTSLKHPAVRWTLGVYLVLVALLWLSPLTRVMHVESSAVVALVAYLVGGVLALRLARDGWMWRRIVRIQALLLLVPLAGLTLSLLWTPNCDYVRGLGFFGLFAGVSLVLALSVAYLLSARYGRGSAWLFVIGSLLIGIATTLYDLGFHPQFYTYNHLYGGVLGPIYDEELAVRGGLFWFRGLTLLWALLFVSLGRLLRGRQGGWLLIAAVVAISVIYANGPAFGINTTAEVIEQHLGSHLATPHFDIYYDAASLSEAQVREVAYQHEYAYERFVTLLGDTVEARIQSYLYPSAAVKADLTGARYTNVAPVWLAAPQAHVLLSSFQGVFPHELAHVFSRRYGLPVLNASWSVGIVEGFAVALEPPEGIPSPAEQVAAAALGANPMPQAVSDLASRIEPTLSPLGFWTGRGAVSYTTMGAFIQHLIDTHGMAPMQAVYARGDFAEVYGIPTDTLATRWAETIQQRSIIDRMAGPLVQRRFARLSLFEQRCPHHIPRHRRLLREGIAAEALGDTTTALAVYAEALDLQPHYESALLRWGRLMLEEDRAAAVVDRLGALPHDQFGVALHRLHGDAFVQAGQSDSAHVAFRTAYNLTPTYQPGVQADLLIRYHLAGDTDRQDSVWASRKAVQQALGQGEWAEALTWLDGVEPIVPRQTLHAGAAEVLNLQAERWRMQALVGAQQWNAALEAAEQLAERYQTLGGENGMRYYRYLAAYYTWRARQPG
ncbi:MAG: hypothetical protein RhofKO_35530 [Rhodothermales bacterium]